MAGDNVIKFLLDLDTKEFKSSLGEAEGGLRAMLQSGVSGASDFIRANKGLVLALGSVAAAAGAVKLAFDAALEGEKIQLIEKQFESLAESVGVNAGRLRESLVQASAGLVNDTDLLKMASQAMVQMGQETEKLPQLMQLAQKATAAFGGTLNENMETLVHAVSNGNTRMLKQLGIIIDSEKAQRDYARALGKSTDMLSEQEKRQATLNAVLTQGGERFKNVPSQVDTLGASWQRLQVAISQAIDGIHVSLSQRLAPTFKAVIDSMTSGVNSISARFLSFFGGESQRAAANTQLLGEKIERLTREIRAYEEAGQGFINGTLRMKSSLADQKAVEQARAELAKYRQEMELAQESARKLESQKRQAAMSEQKPAAARDESAELAQKAKLAELEAKRSEAELKRIEYAQKFAGDLVTFDAMEEMRRERAIQQMNAEIEAIRAKAALTNDVEAAQIREDEIRQQFAERETERQLKLDQLKTEGLQRQLELSQTTSQGIASAFKLGAAQSSIDLNSFAATGRRVFSSFQNQSVSALQAWGAGTKTASEAAKGFIFGMLADEAEARGKLMMLASIFPFNPAGFAAGAGLVALSGFLRAQAGGAGAGMAGGGVGGGGVGGGAPVQDNTAQVQQQEAPRKQVTLQVMGNIYETEQTRTRLLEMIREATDATDFKYQQVGSK